MQISNVGHSTCTLFGYPGVSLLNGSGHQVGLPASHSGSKSTVVIAPGGTAHFVLTVTDPFIVCAHPVKGSVLRVFAPGRVQRQSGRVLGERLPAQRDAARRRRARGGRNSGFLDFLNRPDFAAALIDKGA